MVLTPVAKSDLISLFFDDESQKIIKYFIAKSAFSQPEILPGQDALPFHVPKEHIEQWIVQALGVESVGAGSYPIDVYKPNEWGADVKMLSCKTDEAGNVINGDSGETSLAQKFTDTGVNLDELFMTRQYDAIRNGWCSILKSKLNSVKVERNLTSIYYFIILRAELKFHLCGMQVDIDAIDRAEVSAKTLNSAKVQESVWIDGFIDDALGSVKIYKAKKRMELRLKPIEWLRRDLVLTFAIDSQAIRKKMSEVIHDGVLLNDHIDSLIKYSFSIIN